MISRLEGAEGFGATQQLAAAELDNVATDIRPQRTFCVLACGFTEHFGQIITISRGPQVGQILLREQVS
jgi:hypothetical protein